MTNLGATQVYHSGQFYRNRYVREGAPFQIAGIATDDARPTQIWASAPDQYVLYQTATNFLQGLYPPLASLPGADSTEELTNGTETESPLGGYQFILVHGEDTTSPDTIWIKGDDGCPAYDDASDAYFNSTDYHDTLTSTADFYSTFVPLLGDIMGAENVTYRNAYDVFDLLNVASIHNASVAPEISAEDLNRLFTLANQWEWNRNYNASEPDRSIGGKALAGGFLRQMSSVIDGNARVKFSLMAGSYDTFLSFFGLADMQSVDVNFTGLPDYAASMAFEMYSEADNASFPSANPEDDLLVRFLFRNGTDDSDELTPAPLFGLGQDSTTLSWGRFKQLMDEISITDVADWCTACGATEDFCVAATMATDAAESQSDGGSSSSGSGLSNAAAGGIGAGVTLAVVALVAGLVWLLARRKKSGTTPAGPANAGLEKRTSETESDRV